MTYDFYGTWSSSTGHVSSLLQDFADPDQAGSVKTSMNLYANEFDVALRNSISEHRFTDTKSTALTNCGHSAARA